MIGLAVVGILAAVALPSFLDSMRKGRRSEAFSALSSLQLAEERWRSTNPNYTATLSDLVGVPAVTSSGYYAIAITAADALSYTATATARSGTTQAGDTGCTLLVVNMNAGNASTGSASTALPLTDANRCWAK